jgi:molecular chaperone DnaK (HSP70)
MNDLTAVRNSQNTVTEVKRLLGRSWQDAEFLADVAKLPYKIVADGERVVVDVAYNSERVQLSPEQITAALLTHLKLLAEGALEMRVSGTVPHLDDRDELENLLSFRPRSFELSPS